MVGINVNRVELLRSGAAKVLEVGMGDLPASPVLKTPHFHFRATGSIPDEGTKISHIRQCILKWHNS